MKRTNKKGFTIVELVVVIAVIAILAAVMIPTFSNITKEAKKSALLQEAKNEYTEAYSMDLSDGEIDKDCDNDSYSFPAGYAIDNNGNATYTKTKDGYTATFDGSDWTVEED